MALLHHTDHVFPIVRGQPVRLNWRMLLALGATIGFWVVIAQGIARLAS